MRRLLLLLAGAVVPLVLLGGWATYTNYQAVRAEMEGRLLDGAKALAEDVDREFELGETALAVLAGSSALHRGDLGAFEDEMRAAALRMGVHIGLATPDGYQAANTIWPLGDRRKDVRAPASAMDAFETGRAQISDLLSGPSDGLPVVALSAPVFSPLSAEGGGAPPVSHVLGFILPRERFRAMLAKAVAQDSTGRWGGAVFDRAGKYVARSRADEAWVGKSPQADMLALLARRDEGVARDRKDREGTPIVSAFVRAPRTGFAVVYAAPKDAFYAPLRKTAWSSLGVASAVLAISFGCAVVGGRRLAAAFREIPRGLPGWREGAAPAARSTGLREADDLAAALADAMAERDRAAAELQAVFDVSPVGMGRATLDGRITGANDALLRIVGRDQERLRAGVLRWDDITPPEYAGRDRAALEQIQRHGRCSPYEKEYLRPDGSRVPVLVSFALLDKDGCEGAAFVVDLSDLKRTESALAASEAKLAHALSAARMATWDRDVETDALQGSAGLDALYGREPGGLRSGSDELEVIHPDDLGRVRAATERMLPPGHDVYDEQFRAVWPDGSVRWLHAVGKVTARDAGGAARRASGVVMDVTPLREEQARRDLLIREVDHRAKNVLAVVQAVLKLSAAEDPKEFSRIVEGRIAALAHAHTLLARSQWAGADVRALLDEELAPFLAGASADGGRRVVLEGPPVSLSPWAVQPFAMALHELATNAAKYGALSAAGGGLEVDWRLEGATGDLDLRWKENAARPGDGGSPARRGFGTRVIDSTVRDQLRGSIVRDWAGDGLVCRLRLPASQLAGGQEAAAAMLRSKTKLARRWTAERGGTFDFNGRRVLVVEDEAVLAQALAASLAALGVEVVGPAGSLEDALRLAATAPDLDAAVLDVNLAGQFSFPVADVLAGRGVPIIFATGYASLPADGIAKRHDTVPLLRKPVVNIDLMGALWEITADAAGAAAAVVPENRREALLEALPAGQAEP